MAPKTIKAEITLSDEQVRRVLSNVSSTPSESGDSDKDKSGNLPFTKDHKDPYDKSIDAEGHGLQPVPWRNGEGANMLGMIL